MVVGAGPQDQVPVPTPSLTLPGLWQEMNLSVAQFAHLQHGEGDCPYLSASGEDSGRG